MLTLRRPTPNNATMDELTALQNQMTGFVDQLKAITPGSGCYLNEVCPRHSLPIPPFSNDDYYSRNH